MQTLMLALLPKPAAMGIADRRAYTHAGEFSDPSDKKRYRNDDAADMCIFLA